MDRYKNKYRIASARARFWDYGWNAMYFVTICTHDRKCWFGDISDGVMKLSPIGHIANSCWYEIPNHFPFVELGPHVIMPNHVHGIIMINKPDNQPRHPDVRTRNDGQAQNNVQMHNDVETQDFASLPNHPVQITEHETPKNQFGPQSKNLASIIRGFKAGVTKNARNIHDAFQWQTRYHDHIIRDDRSLHTISEYILHNPRQWKEDQLYYAE